MSQMKDSIAHFVEGWRQQRPDLDPWPLEILGRIQRLSTNLQRIAADGWLKELGLTWESFSLILALRRSGKPYELRPTDIYRESLLTSGAITNRIDRVEKLGLIGRRPDPEDRRSVIVRLTPSGRALADKAVKIHFIKLKDVFGPLTAPERDLLISLLSKMLCSVESGAVKKKSPDRSAKRSQQRRSVELHSR